MNVKKNGMRNNFALAKRYRYALIALALPTGAQSQEDRDDWVTRSECLALAVKADKITCLKKLNKQSAIEKAEQEKRIAAKRAENAAIAEEEAALDAENARLDAELARLKADNARLDAEYEALSKKIDDIFRKEAEEGGN